MTEINDMLPAGFEQFSKDADFLWECILIPSRKKNSQEQFIQTLTNALAYLNGLKKEELRAVCLCGDMAEKVSMIIDLKDYVYASLIDEWEKNFMD